MYTENEKITEASISQVMERAYIDYSMSVIVARALPDVRDGLKPVQRRVLYAMLREGLLHNRAFDKCAGVVGEVLKNYHPHGDSSVYDTLTRLAQDWVMRYPLVMPQGNFGSIEGDSPAAYRYTECKLAEIAEDLLSDIDCDTVDFMPNYKETTTEPVVLPSALPTLLMNGSTGIAVGMTTNIPPHNLGELIDGICMLIDNPSLPMADLMQVIKGPDFPTGGMIVGRGGIDSYMKTGRGIVRIRGVANVEELKNGKEQLVITEIPYNVNRNTLVETIARLVADKVLTEVSDIRNESDENTRVVVELKRGESPRVVLNKLYKHTQLEASFGVILLALDKRKPKQMNIKEMLECYIEHRREVIARRTRFLLRKAEDRAHILEGYKIALNNLDDFIKIIRASKDREEARNKLIAKYPLSERQANAILDLRLHQLTGLAREEIEREYLELMKLIEEYRSILENEKKLLGVIKKELKVMRDKYPSERKSKLIAAEGEFRMEDVIANEGCIISVSHNGFIKRTGVSAYRSQKRGGKGVIGSGQYDEDFIEHIFTASTHDYIMCFMDNGRVYVEKVYEIPEGSRTSKGRSIKNVLAMQPEEKVAAMICVKTLDDDNTSLIMGTKNGVVKKTILSEYKNCRKGGIKGISLDEGDDLIGVVLAEPHAEVVLITYAGMSIRFKEEDLRAQGRDTRGVRGVTLKKENDCVKAIVIADPNSTLLIAGERGQGKRTAYDEYRVQNRGGSGVIAIKTHGVAGALSVREEDEIMMFTHGGQAVRSPVKDIRVIGRSTQGVRLINLAEGDKLVGIARIVDIKDDDIQDADNASTPIEDGQIGEEEMSE